MATDLTQLDNRLTAVDGVGAQVPSQAAIPVIKTDLNGLHTTINQLTLAIQSQLNIVAQSVTTLQSSVNNLLGVSGGNAAARKAFTTTGTTGTVDVLFAVGFTDSNWSAVVSIETATAGVDVTAVRFLKKTDHSGVTVVYTAGAGGLAAIAHVVARHD